MKPRATEIDSSSWTGMKPSESISEKGVENQVPLEDPKGTDRERGREVIRNAVEGGIGGALGPVAAALIAGGRTIFPSASDARHQEWRTAVTDRVNDQQTRIETLEASTSESATKSLEIVTPANDDVATVLRELRQLAATPRPFHEGGIDFIDDELENYRKLINDGKPRTALSFLEKRVESLKNSPIPDSKKLSKATRLFAHCVLLTGEAARASILFDDAWRLDPEDSRNVANRVYGRLACGEYQEAYDIASDAIAQREPSAHLAATFVKAHMLSDAHGEPFPSIPPRLSTEREVVDATIHWHRYRTPDDTWKRLAREAFQRDPSNSVARKCVAEADLEDILGSRHVARFRIGREDRKRAMAAASLLEGCWRQAVASEAHSEGAEGDLANAVLGWHLASSDDRASALANEFLDDLLKIENSLPILLDVALVSGDDRLIEKLAEREFPGAVHLTINRLLDAGEWEKAVEAIEAHTKGFPQDQLAHMQAVAECARTRLVSIDQRAEEYRRLADEFADRIDQLAPLLKFVRMDEGNEELEAEIQRKVGELLRTGDMPIEAREYVAKDAARANDPETVIAALSNYIALDADSRELHILASAFANQKPPTNAGNEFFENLASDIADKEHYRECRAVYEYNRGASDTALEMFERLRAAAPNRLRYLLMTCMALSAVGDQEKILDLVKGATLSSVEGSPAERIEFAQLLIMAGRQEAYGIGYDVVCSNWFDPKINLGYVSLFLSFPSRPTSIVQPDVVVDGSWVTLEDERSDKKTIVVEPQNAAPHTSVSATGPWGRKMIGLRVGDTFEIPLSPIDAKLTVTAVVHRYIGMFRHILATFEERFPGVPGLWKMRIGEDGDLGDLERMLKSQDDATKKGISTYLEKRLPIAMAAHLNHTDVVRFACAIADAGNGLIVAVGDGSETKRNEKAVQRVLDGEAVVIDTITLWLMVETGRVKELLEPFERVLVPVSAFSAIERLFEPDIDGGEERLRVGWRNGRVSVNGTTAAEAQETRKVVFDALDEVRQVAETATIEAGPDLAPELARLISRAGPAFDSHIVANRENATLLSVDLHARYLANKLFKIESVDATAVFKSACEAAENSRDTWLDLLPAFATYGVNYLPVNAPDLVDVFERDISMERDALPGFRAVARLVGSIDADPESHLYAAYAFIRKIWRAEPTLAVQRATSIVLRNLIRVEKAPAAEVVTWLSKTPLPFSFKHYLAGWARGHFITFRQKSP